MREDELSFAGLVALLYGLAAYLLSPALGTSVGRYISYAWPMAWIACPELLVRYFKMSKQLIVRLTWLQAIACWTPNVLRVFGADRVTSSLIAIAVAVPCHVLAIKILRQNRSLKGRCSRVRCCTKTRQRIRHVMDKVSPLLRCPNQKLLPKNWPQPGAPKYSRTIQLALGSEDFVVYGKNRGQQLTMANPRHSIASTSDRSDIGTI